MTRDNAHKLCRTLLDQHGLTGWQVGFIKAKRTCGLCDYTTKTVSLGLPYIARNPDDMIRNTILHEIAHALAGWQAGHGPKWKAVCRQVGCNPERLNKVATMPVGAWRANCPGCDRLYSKHRHTPDPRRTSYCPKCGPDNGKLRYTRRGN